MVEALGRLEAHTARVFCLAGLAFLRPQNQSMAGNHTGKLEVMLIVGPTCLLLLNPASEPQVEIAWVWQMVVHAEVRLPCVSCAC